MIQLMHQFFFSKKNIMGWMLFIFFSLSFKTDKTENKRISPNILFLFSDDHRADALGSAGNLVIQTPHLDKIAKNGSAFTNHYVMGGNHGAICMASRAMLMTGKQLFKVYDRLKDQNTMVANFQKSGYITFGTGKWHNEKEAFERSFLYAKNVYLGGMANHYSMEVSDYDNNNRLGKPQSKGYSTDIFTKSAIEFIENQKNQKKPFFCYVSFTTPHDPFSPEESFIDYYKNDTISIPENFLPLHPFQFDHLTVRDENLTEWPRNPDIIKMILADYYAMITHMDKKIGEIIEALKNSGHYENTIIVFAADNGLAIGSHGLIGKQSLYEHSIKVPLIIQGPGVPKNKKFNVFSYIHDIYPTLAELAGIEVNDKIDGKSLVPVFSDYQYKIRDEMFNAYRNSVRSVRKENWKIIQYPEINYTQLFNLEIDPHETNNLADNYNFIEKKEELTKILLKNQSLLGDTISLFSNNPKSKDYNPDTLYRKPDQWQPEYTLKKYFR